MECQFGNRTNAFRENIKFIIDDEDYDKFVKNYSFRLDDFGYVIYSSRKDGLHNKLLHRVMMGEPDDLQVDHINVNKLDNRRSNLRVCTNQQNKCNSNKYSNNTSGFKGVWFDKPKQKFRARITFNGKKKHLGYFDTAEEAHEAYQQASAKYHGDFGRF